MNDDSSPLGLHSLLIFIVTASVPNPSLTVVHPAGDDGGRKSKQGGLPAPHPRP
jgi:hypothetical protein